MAKACKDCKHFTQGANAAFLCKHPNNASVITGEPMSANAMAVRTNPHKCGPEGRWFESDTDKFSKAAEIPEKPSVAD